MSLRDVPDFETAEAYFAFQRENVRRELELRVGLARLEARARLAAIRWAEKREAEYKAREAEIKALQDSIDKRRADTEKLKAQARDAMQLLAELRLPGTRKPDEGPKN